MTCNGETQWLLKGQPVFEVITRRVKCAVNVRPLCIQVKGEENKVYIKGWLWVRFCLFLFFGASNQISVPTLLVCPLYCLPYLHHQAPRRQVLWYLGAVVTSSKHWRVIVHVRHVNDNRGDVTEGRLPTTSFHSQVMLPWNFKIQRCHEGQKAWCTNGTNNV